MNYFVPQDGYAIINALAKQIQGVDAIEAVDLQSFIDSGKSIMEVGKENVLNALSVLVNRTIIQSRPYTSKLNLIEASDGNMYSNRLRKISYYPTYSEASGMFNTDLNPDNIVNGADNTTGVGTMWEMKLPVVAETNFGGRFVFDQHDTTLLDQLDLAFTGPGELASFLNGKMTEINNDIEQMKESFKRMAVINRAAAVINMVENGDLDPSCAVNLTKEFNTEFGTSYTTDEIMQEHLEDFYKWQAARFQIDSDHLTYRTKHYHWTMPKIVGNETLELLRHSPKNKQKFIYFKPMYTMSKALVLPSIFNPSYIAEQNGEGVDYWQSFDSPQSIEIVPSIPTGTAKNIKIDRLVGILFDEDALMVNFDLDRVLTTPPEARHGYFNTWRHYARHIFNDMSENSIVYYMADEPTEPEEPEVQAAKVSNKKS